MAVGQSCVGELCSVGRVLTDFPSVPVPADAGKYEADGGRGISGMEVWSAAESISAFLSLFHREALVLSFFLGCAYYVPTLVLGMKW